MTSRGRRRDEKAIVSVTREVTRFLLRVPDVHVGSEVAIATDGLFQPNTTRRARSDQRRSPTDSK